MWRYHIHFACGRVIHQWVHSQEFIVIPVDVVTSSLDSHIESLRLLNTLCPLSASGRPTGIKMDSRRQLIKYGVKTTDSCVETPMQT